MKTHWLISLRVLALFTLLTGVGYPLAVTGAARLLFPRQAGGSLVERGGVVVGSSLLAQPSDSPRYFQPRPSAADFATVPSGASNLAPSAPALREAVEKRAAVWGTPVAEVPADLLTASGSGLDPHLSPAAALFQAPSVARARGLPVDQVRRLVESCTEPLQFGILGTRCVNVLKLNLALDELPR